MKRQIIKIDDDKCNGCGLCVPNCAEGALLMIDNKARLISDLFCDGLGACIGHCPQGAISIEEREAEAYDEKRTMIENIIPKGENTIIAHLKHLYDHQEEGYLSEAVDVLKEKNIPVDMKTITGKEEKMNHHHGGGCPGSKIVDFAGEKKETANQGSQPSELTHWPVQLHLVMPTAAYYKGKDLLLAADCVAFAMGNFHSDYLKGKSLAIACPKLDSNKEVYVEKIRIMIDEAKVNTITVMMMEVPCCGGLVHMVKEACAKAKRKVPVKTALISLRGEILNEEWI
ncbi:MAG TPA: 4Fe-4S ferredoxin [Spirochaetia bacterium]|nr:MAG: 4Fe-4S ferredoxin [Spirochaetes bacterium GWB1_36_13]HCL56976.1 4Fe-4S ferredoxin [Spirochaetia bacterium]